MSDTDRVKFAYISKKVSKTTVIRKNINRPYPLHPKFLTWTLPSLNLDTSIVANWDFVQNSITEW